MVFYTTFNNISVISWRIKLMILFKIKIIMQLFIDSDHTI
jgi:hypothetical protein